MAKRLYSTLSALIISTTNTRFHFYLVMYTIKLSTKCQSCNPNPSNIKFKYWLLTSLYIMTYFPSLTMKITLQLQLNNYVTIIWRDQQKVTMQACFFLYSFWYSPELTCLFICLFSMHFITKFSYSMPVPQLNFES